MVSTTVTAIKIEIAQRQSDGLTVVVTTYQCEDESEQTVLDVKTAREYARNILEMTGDYAQ